MSKTKPLDTLQLKDRVFESLGGGKYLSFKDFVINGASLYDKLYNTTEGGDIALFSPKWGSSEAAKYSARLLGNEPPDLENGRTSLYVCSECADPYCGLMSKL